MYVEFVQYVHGIDLMISRKVFQAFSHLWGLPSHMHGNMEMVSNISAHEGFSKPTVYGHGHEQP